MFLFENYVTLSQTNNFYILSVLFLILCPIVFLSSFFCPSSLHCFILLLVVARKQMMLLYGGNFHKVLLKLMESPYKEVQYNCAGIIGHLAMNGSFKCTAIDKPFSTL